VIGTGVPNVLQVSRIFFLGWLRWEVGGFPRWMRFFCYSRLENSQRLCATFELQGAVKDMDALNFEVQDLCGESRLE